MHAPCYQSPSTRRPECLAIDACLGALASPAPERFEESLEWWFTATERFALQLHEADHDAYLTMSAVEYLRQQTPPQMLNTGKNTRLAERYARAYNLPSRSRMTTITNTTPNKPLGA
jgi:hypothetical protein